MDWQGRLVRCEWCAVPLLPADAVKDNRGAPRCPDGASCAVRAGEMVWAERRPHSWPCILGDDPRGCPRCDPEVQGHGLVPPSGRYCCLDPACNHPKEQVFNGGAG